MSDHILTQRRGRWTEVTVDCFPDLAGDQARGAGRLVIRGGREALAAGRRFTLAVGNRTAFLTKRTALMMLDHLEHHVETGEARGAIWTTLVPSERAETYVSAFRDITEGRPADWPPVASEEEKK